jgi:transposase
VELTPYHTQQVIELLVIRPDGIHWLRHPGQCLACGKRCKATVPADQGSGDGPRLPGCVGERAGVVGASRSAVQDLWSSVFGRPLSQGTMPKMVDRISAAILPHYTAIGQVARTSNGQNIRIHLFARGYGQLCMQRACDWYSTFMYNVNGL